MLLEALPTPARCLGRPPIDPLHDTTMVSLTRTSLPDFGGGASEHEVTVM